MNKKTINIEKSYLEEIKETLERCLIILEDNPKIKDVGEFYTSKGLVWEISMILKDLKI
jgi:hypothetical protein